jgi:hypothetical protein
MRVPLSILDLVPVSSGSTASEALHPIFIMHFAARQRSQ